MEQRTFLGVSFSGENQHNIYFHSNFTLSILNSSLFLPHILVFGAKFLVFERSID